MSKSLREQMLEKAGETTVEEVPKDQKSDTNGAPKDDGKSNKDFNLANLRKAVEERDERIQSLQGEVETYKSASSKVTDEKFKPLFEALETEFEDDPSKFLEEFKNLKETSSTWEQKLREKEEILERTAFERSETYKKNIEIPIKSAEETLKGVVKKDDGLYKKILKEFVYDETGKIKTGSLTADEILALDEAVEAVNGVRPERVQVAIENLRERFHSANEFNNSFKSKIQQEEEARQLELARKNKEESDLAKIARASAIKVGVGKFATDEKLAKIFGDDLIKGLGRVVSSNVETMIESRKMPSMTDMAQNQVKAILWDQLEQLGGLDLLVDAIQTQELHSQASQGTRGGIRTPEKKESRSVMEILSEKAGMQRRFA